MVFSNLIRSNNITTINIHHNKIFRPNILIIVITGLLFRIFAGNSTLQCIGIGILFKLKTFRIERTQVLRHNIVANRKLTLSRFSVGKTKQKNDNPKWVTFQ